MTKRPPYAEPLWRNRADNLNARAARVGAEGRMGAKDLWEIVMRDGSACVYCGSQLNYSRRQKKYHPLSRKTATFEHVLALGEGGPHCQENVVCACARCNNYRAREVNRRLHPKGSKPPFAPGKFRFVREAA